MVKAVKVIIISSIILLFSVIIYLKWISINIDQNSNYKIIVVLKSIKQDKSSIWVSIIDGLETAATDFNVKLEVMGPERDSDIFGQIDILESLTESNADAIIVAAADNKRVIPALSRLEEKHIPLIFIDSFSEEVLGQSRIGMDNYTAGFTAGMRAMEHIEKNSLVAILSFIQGSSTAIERENGILDAFGGDMNLIPTFYSGGTIEVSYNQTLKLLNRIPNLKGIITLDNTVTTGAAIALDEMGIGDKVKLIGFGNSLEILGYIQKGIILETIAQKPFNVGYLGVKTALEIIRKGKYSQFIDTGHIVINKSNMFTHENQKILFPVQSR